MNAETLSDLGMEQIGKTPAQSRLEIMLFGIYLELHKLNRSLQGENKQAGPDLREPVKARPVISSNKRAKR